MSSFEIQDFVDVQLLTPARRLVALRRMIGRASELSVGPSLLPFLESALEHQQRALSLENEWRKADEYAVMHQDDAPKLDAQLDRTINGLQDTLQRLVQVMEGDDARRAQLLLDEIFPKGAGAITRLPYVEEHAVMLDLTGKMRSPPLDAHVAALQLERWVERIEELNARYGKLLTRPQRLSFREVRELNLAAWASLVEVVARILGAFPTNSPADIEARRILLQPIVDQQEEAALLRARRKTELAPEGEPPAEAPPEEQLEEA